MREVTAEPILAGVDEKQIWWELLDKKQHPKIRLDALSYLTDRRDGKAKQTIEADVTSQHKQLGLSQQHFLAVLETIDEGRWRKAKDPERAS